MDARLRMAAAVPLSLGWALLLAIVPAASHGAELDTVTRALIGRAGNADNDAERLAVLKQLRGKPDLDPALKADLEKIIPVIEKWVEGRNLHFYSREIGKTKDFDFGVAPESPLYPLTYLYRGRMMLTLVMQSGNLWSYPDRRAEWFGIARGFFEQAREAYPSNRIARMNLGEPIPWEKPFSRPKTAPDWAWHQRLGLEGIADIIEWWIDNRQQDSGAYGGGWGDDCEMWRWWVPVLIGFESPKVSQAQARFSEALMSQEHMRGGYMSRMTDVEHSAEDSTDAILPMMHLAPDGEAWQKRARRLAELMEGVWTGQNERGFLQFKSTYFTVDKVSDDPQKACDTPYHTRAIQPALLYWLRTGDPELTRIITPWMDTWVEATARSENGKPAGVIPAALHWPEGTIGGLSPDWWDPRNHGEPTLYQWPSAMSALTDALLLTYHMTDDEKYLEPIRSMARLRLKHLANPAEGDPEPGSEAWCAGRMGFLSGTLAKYRLLTGDEEFDALLRGGAPFLHFRLTGERGGLENDLRQNAEAFAYNFERYTSEVRYTDRVLRFPAVFRGGVKLAEPKYTVHGPSPQLLYSTVTGDPGGAGCFPVNAVRWLTLPREIAALVTDAGPQRLSAELFHFGAEPREMAAEFYMLQPGKYRLTLRDAANGKQEPLQIMRFVVTGPRAKAQFTLPGQTLCRLEVRGD